MIWDLMPLLPPKTRFIEKYTQKENDEVKNG